MTLGFRDVYDYTDGKLDWMAAGFPTEGTNAERPRVGDLARPDVVTCRLDEQLGDVSERAAAAGSDAAVVDDEERVVLGLLRKKELAGEAAQPVERAMRPGPSTYRPDAAVAEVATFMTATARSDTGFLRGKHATDRSDTGFLRGEHATDRSDTGFLRGKHATDPTDAAYCAESTE